MSVGTDELAALLLGRIHDQEGTHDGRRRRIIHPQYFLLKLQQSLSTVNTYSIIILKLKNEQREKAQ